MSVKARLDRAFFRVPMDAGEVTLSQRRVYLLPSGRGMAVALTGLVMLLVGMNYGVSLAYLAAFLIAGYLVCALIAAFRNMVNLKVSLTACENAHAGESVGFQFALETDRDRYFVTLASTHAVTMVDRMRLGVTPARLNVPTQERGTIALGRVRIQSIAPTGLIRAFSYVHFPEHAVVYPPLLRPAPALPRDDGLLVRVTPQSASPTHATVLAKSGDALDGVREYQMGDSLARVAWNAVARGQAWRSKLLSADAPQSRTFRWAQTAQFGNVDQRLAALTTWVVEAHRHGEAYALSIPGAEIPTAQHSEHRVRCLTALATAHL